MGWDKEYVVRLYVVLYFLIAAICAMVGKYGRYSDVIMKM